MTTPSYSPTRPRQPAPTGLVAVHWKIALLTLLPLAGLAAVELQGLHGERLLLFWISLLALLIVAAAGVVMLLFRQQRGRNRRLEMQVQADSLLRQFYDLPFIGIGLLSATSRQWLKCNDRLCEILGYSRAEMTSMSFVEMTHAEDSAAEARQLERVLRGESDGYLIDRRFIRQDGSTVFTSLDVKCVRRDDGAPEYLLATVQDITERKQAAARVERLTRMYAALSECNQAIVRCTSEQELFPLICRFAVQFGGMKMAWIGMLDPASRDVRPVASFGDGTDFLHDVQVSADIDSPFGQGSAGTAIRQLKPVWIHDYLNDPITAPWHERGARAGWLSSAALPLTCNELAVGAFMLYAGEVDAFDDPIRNLLVEMALDISFALTSFAKEARAGRRRWRYARAKAGSAICTKRRHWPISRWTPVEMSWKSTKPGWPCSGVSAAK